MPVAASQALLRRLEWRVRDTAGSLLVGDYRSAFRGRGREFDQVVKYEYGDDVRDIDWNVTARRGEPYRKKFVEEREISVVLLLEDSLSLQFGSQLRSKRETLLETAGLLALISAGSRDRVGAWHATPGGEEVLRLARGRSGVLRTAAHLLSRPAPSLEPGRAVEIDWRRLYHAFPRHSVLVWLSDFPPREPPAALAALRRRYELIGVRAEDPWERELPRLGWLATVDPASGELLPLDTSSAATRRRHAAWAQERERRFRELFPSAWSRLRVGSDEDPLEALVRFFRARMRRLRPG